MENKLINLYHILKKIDPDFSIVDISYFTKEQTVTFLENIDKLQDYDYTVIKNFLKTAIERYNGIYILGV